MKNAVVYICGAGPGDPDLITVKGHNLLKKCDVVLYDRLVSTSLIEMIPSKTEKIYVGRARKATQFHQSRTNRLMVSYIRQGKNVLRLKGGDPLIFGRGAEEAEYLRRHNIRFEIVPGISSAIGGPTYAGIPLTHRRYSSSVAIVTGHEGRMKSRHKVDLRSIASAVDTVVILMGIERIQNIVQELRAGGLRGETRVAIVEKGTLCAQRVVTGNLNTIARKVAKYRVIPPAVMVVGPVVSLSKRLSWYKTNV